MSGVEPVAMTYEERVAKALSDYARLTGRALDPTRFDRRRPELRAAYDDFRRRLLPSGLGANDGEWIGLRLGIKPIVRELVDAGTWAEHVEAYRAEGFICEVRPLDAAMDPVSGLTARRGFREWSSNDQAVEASRDALARSAGGQMLAVVGRDPDRIRRAIELDVRLIGGDAGNFDAGPTRELGDLLGYPSCCAEAFAIRTPLHNRELIGSAADASVRFWARLNISSLRCFHYIAHYPCRFDCPASAEIAAAIDEWLLNSRPRQQRRAFQLLSMPRIYFDDRRQIIFDGAADRDTIRYRAVHTPYALDRDQRNVGLEWVFFIDQVAPLLKGDRVEMVDSELAVYRGAELVGRVPFPDGAVWLPFTPD